MICCDGYGNPRKSRDASLVFAGTVSDISSWFGDLDIFICAVEMINFYWSDLSRYFGEELDGVPNLGKWCET